ncbi:DDRGK domain protein [Toxoplasma gondii MAS]|uniref:DDRGK domain protein n=2 Tax=Toxoplasma gondii TaxID=5811 RepID=A0A086PT86_TOXGO|nr:DDRGK domain protein [Toxoplasma gondii MAS]PUA90894.1 DDRGK domain protein [Toxoplasma gondii TgCATBr9]
MGPLSRSVDSSFRGRVFCLQPSCACSFALATRMTIFAITALDSFVSAGAHRSQSQSRASSAESDASGRHEHQANADIQDDFTGGQQIPLSIVAFLALVGIAVYLYRLLNASDEKQETSTRASSRCLPQRSGPQNDPQARRRRMDRCALESMIAAPREGEQQCGGDNGRTGALTPREECPGVATAVGALTAARRRRAEREARREERRHQQEQRNERGEESDGEGAVGPAASKKGESYRLRQLEREKERIRREAEEKRKEEEKRKQEEDEYNQWKATFSVEESGEMVRNEEEENREVDRFISFIKVHKLTELDDLAAEFGLLTKDVIQRIRSLEETDRLSGILDDRGKYVYITEQELDAVAEFLKTTGRIHKVKDLVPACNRMIRLHPTEEDKKALKEEERRAMNLIKLDDDVEH